MVDSLSLSSPLSLFLSLSSSLQYILMSLSSVSVLICFLLHLWRSGTSSNLWCSYAPPWLKLNRSSVGWVSRLSPEVKRLLNYKKEKKFSVRTVIIEVTVEFFFYCICSYIVCLLLLMCASLKFPTILLSIIQLEEHVLYILSVRILTMSLPNISKNKSF